MKKKITKPALYFTLAIVLPVISVILFLNFQNSISLIIRNYSEKEITIQKLVLNEDKNIYNGALHLSVGSNRSSYSGGFAFNHFGYFKSITLAGYSNKPFSRTCEFKKIDNYCIYVIAIESDEKMSCYCDDTSDFKY